MTFFKEHSTGFLILHPQSFDASNVMAFLLAMKELAGNKVAIVTENPMYINSKLYQVLPDDLYVRYDQFTNSKLIQEIIKDQGFIFIDDYSKYQEYKIGESINEQDELKCKIVCLTNGISLNLINDNWSNLSLHIFDEGPLLNYDVKSVNKDIDKNGNNTIVLNVLNTCLINYDCKHAIYTTNFIDEFNIIKNGIDNVILIQDDNMNQVNSATPVEYLHIVDLNLQTFIQLMKLYRRSNFNLSTHTFNIIFYIDESSTDIDEYPSICDYINEYRNNYLDLFKRCNLIKFNQELGVYVDIK